MTSKIAKLVIQILSAVIGLLGLISLILSVIMIIMGISKEIVFILFAALFLMIGLLFLATAYSALFRFKKESISNVTFILGFVIFGQSSDVLRQFSDNPIFENSSQESLLFVIPVIMGILTHVILKWIFVKLIYKDIQPVV
ncbi:hypothetical protein EGM51_09900 [Verrucomicrobia bacterium S94]|nr:hypothetical protein EGM51_09900 [Verrucomicrobia bacterium S94]